MKRVYPRAASPDERNALPTATSRSSGVTRRAALAAGAAVAALPGVAGAQAYPDRPVRLVVPFAPGGINDLAARLIGARMGAVLGVPVVVENRAGGGARIGAEYVARAPRDGYTVLFCDSISFGSLPAIVRDLAYDPLRDFAPVGPVADYANLLVCTPGLPFRNVSDLVARVRERPGSVRYASSGPGTGNHFAGELFNRVAGVRMEHVPYRGAAPAVQDVIAGIIECAFTGAAYPQIASGQVRAIATTGAARDPRLPEVPTVAEGGLAGYDMTFWQGLAVPAGTPPEVVNTLATALRTTLEDAALRERLFEVGLNLRPGGPEDLAALTRRDLARYREIVEVGGLRFD